MRNSVVINLMYAPSFRFARTFIDIREREKNERRGSKYHGRQLMNVHNNEAGRRVRVVFRKWKKGERKLERK